MDVNISYDEDVQEHAQGHISKEIAFLTDLFQKILVGELDYHSTTIPDWIREYYVQGYSPQSDWLFDLIKKVDRIQVEVTKMDLNYGTEANIWFCQDNKRYPYQYRLQFWLDGTQSVCQNSIDTD